MGRARDRRAPGVHVPVRRRLPVLARRPAAILVLLVAIYRPGVDRARRRSYLRLLAIAAAMLLQLCPSGDDVGVLSGRSRHRQGLNLTAVLGAAAQRRRAGDDARDRPVKARWRLRHQPPGVRRRRGLPRGVATVGLVLAAISLAQDATAHGLMLLGIGRGPAALQAVPQSQSFRHMDRPGRGLPRLPAGPRVSAPSRIGARPGTMAAPVARRSIDLAVCVDLPYARGARREHVPQHRRPRQRLLVGAFLRSRRTGATAAAGRSRRSV